MSHYREPPIDTVIRHLCRASQVVERRRVVAKVRDAVGFALTEAFKEQERRMKKRHSGDQER